MALHFIKHTTSAASPAKTPRPSYQLQRPRLQHFLQLQHLLHKQVFHLHLYRRPPHQQPQPLLFATKTTASEHSFVLALREVNSVQHIQRRSTVSQRIFPRSWIIVKGRYLQSALDVIAWPPSRQHPVAHLHLFKLR